MLASSVGELDQMPTEAAGNTVSSNVHMLELRLTSESNSSRLGKRQPVPERRVKLTSMSRRTMIFDTTKPGCHGCAIREVTMLEHTRSLSTTWRRAIFFALLTGALIGLACTPPETGSSDNGVQKPGRQERGRSAGSVQQTTKAADGSWVYTVGYSDIVLAPDGHTLLVGVPVPGPNATVLQPTLQLVAYDLDTGVQTALDAHDVIRIQFSIDGKLAWLLTDRGTVLKRLEIATGLVVTHTALPHTFTTLDRTPDGLYVVLANLPLSDEDEATFNATTCEVSVQVGSEVGLVDRCAVMLISTNHPNVQQTWSTPRPVRDLDFSPFRSEIILTWSDFNEATLAFCQPHRATFVATATAPNCGDELVIAPAFGKALLAPSRCKKDPISVFDLDKRTFITNLPGFGPVAIVGNQAIGFTTRQALQNTWFLEQKTAYGLIQVDLETLEWKVHDWGSSAPTFTAAPDGQHLLVWQKDAWTFPASLWNQDPVVWQTEFLTPARLTRIHVADWQETPMQNPSVRLESFAWRADGDTLVALSNHLLFRLHVATAEVEWLPLDVAPALLQQRPNSEEILLGEGGAPQFYRMNLDTLGLKSFAVSLGANLSGGTVALHKQTVGWDSLILTDDSAVAACGDPKHGSQVDAVVVSRNIGGEWHEIGYFMPLAASTEGLFCTIIGSVGEAGDGKVLNLRGVGVALRFRCTGSSCDTTGDHIVPGDHLIVTAVGAETSFHVELANVLTSALGTAAAPFPAVKGADGTVTLVVP
jgi:hypothetical protein